MIAANSIVIFKAGEREVVCCGNTGKAFRRDCDVGANGIDRDRRSVRSMSESVCPKAGTSSGTPNIRAMRNDATVGFTRIGATFWQARAHDFGMRPGQ
jgi:hypothetical protein